MLLNATLPEEVIDREKAVQIAATKAEDEHLTSVARNLLRKNLFGSHPYALRSSAPRRPSAAWTVRRSKRSGGNTWWPTTPCSRFSATSTPDRAGTRGSALR